jgi:hypothetical protein
MAVALEAFRKCSVSWILCSKHCPEKKLAWKFSFAVGILEVPGSVGGNAAHVEEELVSRILQLE